MKPFSSEVEEKSVVEVDWADRWQVYQRLQELEIPCWCEANQPLKVELVTPMTVVQLWSVMRQFTSSRRDLIYSLEINWQSGDPYS
ncbi:Asr1405/Asl0597 family protein [Anabaena sp. CCY 9910]|uniref:Asr1405/Asl0597 family protein n=1 Tax=Anabaena sp. CCY 9910 TaxID=3103870 RepID=UPI0039E1DA53